MAATQTTGRPSRGRPRGFDRDTALRSAMEVFWQRGYDGASISGLAQTIGINPPSLYAAFGSKEALFREAVELYGTLEGSATQRALREGPTARQAVETMLRDNVDIYTDPSTPTGCLVVLGATTSTPENAAVRDLLASLRHRTFQTLRERLRQALTSGELAPGTDADALAGYYNTVLEGLSIRARDGTSRAAMHAIIDCAMATWDALLSESH